MPIDYFERCMIPLASIVRNLALAEANLFGGNRQACAWMGGGGGGACGVDTVFHTMLDVQSGEVRPCTGLCKVGQELVMLISFLGNGAEVEHRDPRFAK